MRIFVPLRAGHVIRVKNTIVNVNQDHLVTELAYDEGSGITLTSISSIGQNDSAAAFRASIFKQVVDLEISDPEAKDKSAGIDE